MDNLREQALAEENFSPTERTIMESRYVPDTEDPHHYALKVADGSIKKKRGNPNFYPGMPALNPHGRPKKILDKKVKSNRELRYDEYLGLIRKFRPHLTRAVQAAVKIIDNREASDTNKLKASALIISTYKDLIRDLYDIRYDDEEGTAIQQSKASVLSLKVIETDGGD